MRTSVLQPLKHHNSVSHYCCHGEKQQRLVDLHFVILCHHLAGVCSGLQHLGPLWSVTVKLEKV